jgi:hypothetical protein
MPGSRTEEIMSFQTKLGSDPGALKNAGLSCGEVRSAAREVLAVDDLAVWLSRPALS